MNQIDLAGRRAVVTGAARGIGRAIAARLLASGASCSLWDVDKEAAVGAAKEFASQFPDPARVQAVQVERIRPRSSRRFAMLAAVV